MLGSSQSAATYSLVSSDESNEAQIEKSADSFVGEIKNKRNRYIFILCTVICILLGCAVGLLIASFTSRRSSSTVFTLSPECDNPTTRREWRSLSRTEKHDYIEAVQCLRTTPSRLELNQSLYDDFPYTHNSFGDYSHGAAAFLTWHRYFIHTYERALQEQCHYGGHLAYWDWGLDWEDLTKAPVWDPETAFGGSGDPNVGESIMQGHCVVDGPFAMLEVLYLKDKLEPHCLSRGFESGAGLEQHGQHVRPEALQRLLALDEYDAFNTDLEYSAHNAIPRSIRGDFLLFTAPYDPVFFLHHTQLDRLWWTWQHMEPEHRMMQYAGPAAHGSTNRASLDDTIPLGGLAPDIQVSEIIRTDSHLLCYRY